MVGFLLGVVRWIVVPAVMLIGLVLALVIARNAAKESVARVGAWAGLLAGLVAGSAFAITQAAAGAQEQATGFRFNVLSVVLGLVIGFGLPYLFLMLAKEPRLVGLGTLVLSSASSLGLLNYLFSGAVRDFIMLMSMSMLFGLLIFFVVNPHRFPELKVPLVRATNPR
ncbi:hypothetical protein [Actinophytocola sp.]|uniref:hypothetical protein n=1 Tax=Actinophytocola sp. TaxID=1872138 RepID=UPI002ED58D5A